MLITFVIFENKSPKSLLSREVVIAEVASVGSFSRNVLESPDAPRQETFGTFVYVTGITISLTSSLILSP